MTLLRLEKVSSAYGQSKVLWDIDMDIEAGSAVALIGRNGVGKTTLLKTIVGVQKITGGHIHFGGADVTAAPAHGRARAGIGYVPQGRHVFPHLTVLENLTVGLAALTGRKSIAQTGIAEHIFDLFPKLQEIRARKAGLLSGGEQQQLAIGRALAGQPKLLLLDEPTEGIQPSVVKQIEHALRRERFDVGQACAWVVAQLAPGAAARGIAIRIEGDTQLEADPLLLRQALANLLSNAIRHSADDGEILISQQADADGGVELRVRDQGEGIDAEHIPYLFDRFYQVDAARRRGVGQGTGLGLSIVKTIVDLHGGSIRRESEPGMGTTAILYFPAAGDRQSK
ncbi:MAG: hypothetical protein B7Z81_04650 [Acidocella sp. 20-61-6]|nr:MAG: hypothetical protein B7Z81_04650 [Acidocella sp. 20-61-6]